MFKKTYKSTRTVHLEKNLHQDCRDIAHKDNTTIQNIVNTGVREYINRRTRTDFLEE